MPRRSAAASRFVVPFLAFIGLSLLGFDCPGLTTAAYLDIQASGIDKYVGDFDPASSTVMGDWTRHTFDSAGGSGPTCIDGSDFTVFIQERDPEKVLIYLNGGGACWQNFYFCTTSAPTSPPGAVGIFADDFDAGGGTIIDNPLEDWSKVFVSYCDGSVFTGDNEVADASFPEGPIRYHRGMRNLSAAMDLARDRFGFPDTVMLAGSSAGGYGVAAYAPAVFRAVFYNWPELLVFNDAGPALANLSAPAGIQAREDAWSYLQFTPSTCTDCTLFAQPAEYLEWNLDSDPPVREALYSTDADFVIRFFLGIGTQVEYRNLLLSVHDPIVANLPTRYKRFIRSGDSSHTSLATDLFYTSDANGVPLYQWTEDFVNDAPGWTDEVEPLVPAS